jgi:hypothetical protein
MSKTIALIAAMCVLVIGYTPCANATVITDFRAGGYYSTVTIPIIYDPNSVSFNAIYSSGYANPTGLGGYARSMLIDERPYYSLGDGQANFSFSDDVTSIRLSFDYSLSGYIGFGQIHWYVNTEDPLGNMYARAGSTYGETASGTFDHIFTRTPASNPLYVDLYALGESQYGYSSEGGFHCLLGSGSAIISNLRVEPIVRDNSVPEPSTMFLLGFGLIGLIAYGRKKFRE